MQLNPLDAATLASALTGSAPAARVVAGNLAAVPVGELLAAVVTSAAPREAVLNVGGQQLTIRTPPGQQLRPGAAVVVRVPPGAANATNPTIEFAVQPNPAASQRPLAPVAKPLVGVASEPARPLARPDAPALPPPRLAVVDVLAPLPDGRVRVQFDGVEQVATTAEPLVPGGRYVLQVERSPVGIRLSAPPPQSAPPAIEVATAVLRAPAPTLPAALKPLRAELATLTAPPKPNAPPVPAAVREAAAAVETTLRTIVPSEPKPPDATQLRQLVENGGLHYEAKLARQIEPLAALPARPDLAQAPTAKLAIAVPNFSTEPEPTTAPKAEGAKVPTPAVEVPARGEVAPAKPQAAEETKLQAEEAKATADLKKPAQEKPTTDAPKPQAAEARSQVAEARDLKGDLLRLLQAVNELGEAARAPAAEAALRGIESQQAANVIAQTNNTPYFLQVPFPDRGEWKTLSLSLEPQHRPDQSDAERAGRFRVFMHVPLTDLGETWIDAGLSGDQFRATIYLDRAQVRDRVRAALPELNAELQAEGFSEVLLDVQSSGELPAGRRRAAGATQAGRPDAVSVLDVRA